MRVSTLIVPTLLLASCGAPDESVDTGVEVEPGIYAAGERGGLCVAAGGAAAFVIYGEDDANCMAQGGLSGEGDALTFKPRGDTQCEIPIRMEGERLVFGEPPAACAYYCGGDVDLSGRELVRSDEAAPLTDVAGEEIC
ncbi:hypothetical protein [Sphingomicrobium clamense]|uniref:Lipoprotein n=1 Tax=Sphingomicrobium clamense TaxID=2851013 RepID=A0ABS6V853_9SPHN|nr:hypothetical protein [Sphingomicrobium sp. B8]MBW0145520.1 hypothetical protein [Sphingomicrobium sp. B8]